MDEQEKESGQPLLSFFMASVPKTSKSDAGRFIAFEMQVKFPPCPAIPVPDKREELLQAAAMEHVAAHVVEIWAFDALGTAHHYIIG